MTIKGNELYRILQRIDVSLYSFLKQLKKLSKKQQRILLCLVFLSLFAFMSLINAMVDNNAAWLDGSWSNGSNSFSIKAKNESCRVWNVKEDNQVLMENALIAVNSTKKNIVLTKDGSSTEYHFTKLNKKQIDLRVINEGEQIKQIQLKRYKKAP